jgi:DNA-binding MarR family transcriptional regulator
MPSTTTADPLQLDRQVCFALAVASRSVIAIYRPLLEPMGLTHPQYLVMLSLWELSPRPSKDIASALQLDIATLSPMLKRLEADGLITRDRDPRDERQLQIQLTPKGVALRTQAERVPGQVVARLGVPIGSLEALRDSLTEVIAAATR